MTERRELLVAFAGQQNAGKSTLFNVLTGARQHVANYPGVTVDKKYGYYHDEDGAVRTVDLPGTYSLTSFSLEERVARDFLLGEKPDVVINVVDASNLRRSLHLTLQILELELPTLLALNMMDVARGRGIRIDEAELATRLGIPVVPTVGRKGTGREALRREVRQTAGRQPARTTIDYGALESSVAELDEMVSALDAAAQQALTAFPRRWLVLKLLEGDAQVVSLLRERLGHDAAARLLDQAGTIRTHFERAHGLSIADHVVHARDEAVSTLLDGVLEQTRGSGLNLTERLDRLLLNRWAAPFFLVLTVYLIYQIAIVWGYELTTYTWPLLAHFREFAAEWLPSAGFLVDPYSRALGLWLVDSANTLLNYVPIFLILFALIAILEDSGYMARIAFILDKILHLFGLHGQSTLPLILGGVFAGGCAVPGVMATKGIPDNRARMATILTVPYMNCLAKVPLYTLLLGVFFVENKSLMMFYISTMTIVFALLVSKLLTKTVLRGHETSPFVMELPAYHLPTFGGVLRRALDRTWLYIKKVGTIVVAVAVVIFALLQFPGLSDERMGFYESKGEKALNQFYRKMGDNPYAEVASKEQIVNLLNYYDAYKRAKLNSGSPEGAKAVSDAFAQRNPEFFPLVAPPRGDKDARDASRSLRRLAQERKLIRKHMKSERIDNSLLGTIGHSLEPVTQFAGFDWKINVALLSSFAARESSVATLGVLFQQSEDENATLEERMGAETRESGATALLAVSMILFFALYPPCLATTVMVKVQTGSYKWMIFSIIFPTLIGLAVSSLVFTLGIITGASGIEAMSWTYWGALALLVVIGLWSNLNQTRAARELAKTTSGH